MYALRELVTQAEMDAARSLLDQEGLLVPDAPDYGVGFFAAGRLVATGFRKGAVLMGLCVASAHRGGALAGALVTQLIAQANSEGIGHLFLFTKPDQALSFQRLGFSSVGAAPGYAALLEFGWPDFGGWVADLKNGLAPAPSPESAAGSMGAVVMNANPFTLGHRHLARQAAAACARLYLFVVEEDASAFPFATRLRLVREGVADIANCVVLPGGPYMVTSATFPSYFTGKAAHAAAHAALDATIFATRIAPELRITRRFVGTEPYSEVTARYNAALARILPDAGVRLDILDRVETGGEPISASRVRGLLAHGDLEAVRPLVPATTFAWLQSNASAQVRGALVRASGADK